MRRAHAILTLEALTDILQLRTLGLAVDSVSATTDDHQIVIGITGDGLPEICETTVNSFLVEDTQQVSLIYTSHNLRSVPNPGIPFLTRVDHVPRKNIMPEDRVIYAMAWKEIESGWGERPDGMTIHATLAHALAATERALDRARTRDGGVTDCTVPSWDRPRRIYVEPGSEIERLLLNATQRAADAFHTGALYVDDDLEQAITKHLML